MSRLAEAFKELRKRGYLARMNFSCCQGCAGYELTTYAVELISTGKRTKESIRGCVFFHAQDNDGRRERGEFYLAHGPMNSREYGTIGIDSVEIGKEVCEVLAEFGVKTEWDGDPNTRIWVRENPRKEVKCGQENGGSDSGDES